VPKFSLHLHGLPESAAVDIHGRSLGSITERVIEGKLGSWNRYAADQNYARSQAITIHLDEMAFIGRPGPLSSLGARVKMNDLEDEPFILHRSARPRASDLV